MQYPETPEKASKSALAAFKRLNELDVAANPINFAIWYDYFAGKNHDLKKPSMRYPQVAANRTCRPMPNCMTDLSSPAPI